MLNIHFLSCQPLGILLARMKNLELIQNLSPESSWALGLGLGQTASFSSEKDIKIKQLSLNWEK